MTRYAYDELSKLVSVLDAGGGEHSFVYDEARNLLAKQDANGNLTTYAYDALDRRTDERQHLDAHGRVRSRAEVPDAAAEGPADPVREAGALHWHARYDENGNLTERTDPRGFPVVSTYGILDRLETETFPEPVLGVAYPYPLDVTYAYDGNGNLDLVTERKRTAAGVTGIVTAKEAIADTCADPARMVSRFGRSSESRAVVRSARRVLLGMGSLVILRV